MFELTRFSNFIPKHAKAILRPFVMFLLKSRIKRLYSKFVSSGDLVFDVGAHTGDMTDVFLKMGANVVSIEPQPQFIEILKKNFGEADNFSIIGKGVGQSNGTAVFWICENDPSISTFCEKWKTGRFSKQKWSKSISVPVTTLDSLIAEFGTPKFCKIDVEGYELEVLLGLSSKIQIISFEFTKEFLTNAKLCADHLNTLGKAKFNYSLYSEFKLISKEWLDSKDLFNNLESIPDHDLCGDIYVKIE